MNCYLLRIIPLLLLGATFSVAEEMDQASCEQACLGILQVIQDPTTDKEEAEKELTKGRFILTDWSEQHPTSILILHTTGLAYISAGEPLSALPYLKKAYKISDQDAAVGDLYSLALKMSKKPRLAIRVKRQIADENPDQPMLRYSLGIHLMLVQDYEEALEIIQSFRLSSATPPDEQTASHLSSVGECELYLGRHEQAVTTLEEAQKFLPDAIVVLNLLAEAYIKNGQIEEAKDTLRKALKLKKDDRDANYWTGIILELANQPASKKFYRKALAAGEAKLERNAENGVDHFRLSQVLTKIGETKRAKEYKQRAAELFFTYEAPWNK